MEGKYESICLRVIYYITLYVDISIHAIYYFVCWTIDNSQ